LNHPSKTSKAGVLIEGVFLPLLFFTSLWLILPSVNSTTWTWALGFILIAATLVLLFRSKEHWPFTGNQYYFSKKDALFDVLILLSPLVLGFTLAGGFQVHIAADRVINSLLIYPVYALLQLSIFLAIPATRMLKLEYSSRTICMICALVFGLVHLPNPLLMLFTGMAMMVFCSQFLRGRSILVLALIMGIAATGFRFAVPFEWSGELRIGPDYIEKRQEQTE